MFYSHSHMGTQHRKYEVEAGVNFDGLVVGQDLATATSGLFNCGYFAHYGWRGDGRHGRRAGAAALALVSGAAVIESVFSQALFWIQQDALAIPAFSSGVWALLRLPLLVATLAISAIILRRIGG